jgi:hypothetical protein
MGRLPDWDGTFSSPLADWELELLGITPPDELAKAELMYEWEEFSE